MDLEKSAVEIGLRRLYGSLENLARSFHGKWVKFIAASSLNMQKIYTARGGFLLLIAFGLVNPGLAITIPRSDILLHIVSQCVDPKVKEYCSQCLFPRMEANCDNASECKKTTEVWAINNQYAAIRDIKMCGCPVEFVHGLAMPRSAVSGVEDPRKQEEIWQFAWDAAIERIEVQSIALVVNPPSHRSQNQLHIHLLRLENNARGKFTQYPHEYIQNLDQVWLTAARLAATQGLNEYGVLVAKESSQQYIVVVTLGSPEAEFTQWRCD